MSSCADCNSSTPKTITLQYTTASCAEDSDCIPVSSKCIYYGGPNLSCSGINTDDSIELSLQKIDELLCQAAGDYSAYNFHCLDDDTPITTEAEFVSAITDYVCDLSAAFTAFTGTTFVDYQGDVDNRFSAIEGPATTCVAASITSADSLSQILSKYCTKFASLDTALDISTVTWNSCFTVATSPTTLAEGFDLLADQICQVKTLAQAGGLPTFDNTGSCLATPTATDSLVDTIAKIKTRLCQSPTLDNSSLTSSCISIPATATDLETLLQSMLTKLDTLTQNLYTFDAGDFAVSATDEEDVCAGKTVALQTPINQDRFVAANASDSSPSTLIDKLIGVNCTIDDTTNAGKITITATAAASGDHKVLANSADSAAGYLDEKVEGQTNDGIILNASYNSTSGKLDITPYIDSVTLVGLIFDAIEDNETLKERFCALMNSCPSPCDPPTNVQAVALTTTSTTTTTTTTTA